jgi:aspartate/methionine/tyrosine aminotransferase
MKIAPFAIEEFFAHYEFTTPHLLCASDCEAMTIGELLELAEVEPAELHKVWLGYTESQGNPELRAAVARTYQDVAPEEVVILTAPEEGIYLAMQQLLEPGDEVVVLAPAYESLRNVAEHICGREKVKPWWVQPAEGGWQLDLNTLESLVTPYTKLVIVNFPHNPTGYLPSEEEFRAILEIAGRYGAWLFCDEMYRGLELNGRTTLPSAADVVEHSFVLSGLSKVHGLPGLRSGWLVIKEAAAREQFIAWKHYTTICPPAPSEFLAMVGLKAQEKLVVRNRGIIEENLVTADSFFVRHPDLFVWRRPQAGSVALVGLNQPSAAAYCQQLAASAGVLLLPSSYLGYDDRHVRFGFGRRGFAAALAQYEKAL